ncbi:MAG: RadC family protein [Candidatus Riflebacteria bacterium]|nr:RadC family protein [Candidatus Riflebacteria bacterium]
MPKMKNNLIVSEPDYLDHRSRLRERFDSAGIAGFAEHEVIEFLLTFAIPRVDTKPIAKKLMSEFTDIPGIFSANREQLEKISGIGPNASRFLILLKEVSQLVVKRKVLTSKKQILNGRDVVEYYSAVMANLNEEEFRVLYLNQANRVISDEILSKGVEEQTAVYPRKILRQAVFLYATCLILVHNHPTGRVMPSLPDREITKVIKSAAETVGIKLLDHIIMGREGEGYYSFQENGIL